MSRSTGVLLDTNAALWVVAHPGRLGADSHQLIASQPVWVSAASLWEVEIKRALGKLALDDDLGEGLRRSGVRELPVRWAHFTGYADADLPHRDPFDRMLVAQASVERLTFLTADRQILAAGLPFVRDARA